MWGKIPCVVDPVKCFLHALGYDMVILGTLVPKMAKTPLQPTCAVPEQLCQG